MMKACRFVAVAAVGLFGVACGPAERGGAPEGEAPEAAVEESSVGVRLEMALRAVDLGQDLESAEQALEAIVGDPAATEEQRDEARLGLSRVAELSGDEETAVEIVEALMAAHAEDDSFASRDAAEKRLRMLLTGKPEAETLRMPLATPLPPAAYALAALWEPNEDGRVLVDMLILGTSGRQRSPLFDVAEAKREETQRSFGPVGWVGQSISQTGSWVSLPTFKGETRADMPHPERSLLVFYFDLENHRVPSRYDAYLPMPSDEIVARLERGEGLVVAKKRPGAKPTLVIAAPRQGQLTVVEAALEKMSEIPFEPVAIELPKGATADEIQATIRATRVEMKECYEGLLKRDPKAEGKITIKFDMPGDGTVANAHLGEDTTLKDRDLEACILGVVGKLKFPVTGERQSVGYPIVMSP